MLCIAKPLLTLLIVHVSHRVAIVTILQVRSLTFTDDVNEFNDNSETPLMAATADGASEADLCLLVKVLL